MERLGAYDVIGRIGTGGSADLLLAVRSDSAQRRRAMAGSRASHDATAGAGGEAPPSRPRVVLKKLHAHLAEDDAYVRMFAAEARVMSHLHHEHVVRATEMEEDDGAFFFAMDLVDGPNLAAIARLYRVPLPVDVAIAIAADVADALAYVHGATSPTGEPLALVHRDIAASNILVSRDGDVKLTDFGVVKLPKRSTFLSSASTSGGVLKGHLATMAPEVVRGTLVDARADLYSLAVVLWETIEGRKMFDGTPLELVEKVVNDAPPAMEQPIDDALRALIESALAKDPTQRPATSAAFRDALRSFGPASKDVVATLVRSLRVPSLAA